MAHVLGDLVHETTTTTGTGDYGLDGAVANRFAFSKWLGDGDTIDYAVTDGVDFESGIGTFDSVNNTLARTTIVRSTNGGAAVSWGTGTRDILSGPLGGRLIAMLDQNLGNGVLVKKGLDDWVARALGAGTHISVANADGTGGNPTPSVITGTSGAKIPLLNTDVTWTSLAKIIEKGGLGAQFGPRLDINRLEQRNGNSSLLRLRSWNDSNSLVTGGQVVVNMQTLTAGAEDTQLRFGTTRAGAFVNNRMTLGAGLQVGSPTGGDKGAGKFNAVEIYENDVRVSVLGASGRWEQISVANPSGVSSVDITGFDSAKYSNYMIVFEGLTPATDKVILLLRTSSDGGSTFDSGASDYSFSGRGVESGFGGADIGQSSDAFWLNESVREIGSAVNENLNGVVMIYRPDASLHTGMTWHMEYISEQGLSSWTNASGRRLIAAVVNAVRVLFSSGNIASGTVRFLGLVK